MNPAAILALIGDLYEQIVAQREHIETLTKRVAELEAKPT